MNVIIVGAGKTGFSLAQKLLLEDKTVVIIEKDREKALFADNNLDCQVLVDYGNNLDVLKKAGIQKADFFIALTESDEINMISCALVSSEFEKPVTIARVRNIDYSHTQIVSEKNLGIDHVINPEIELARTIINTIEHGARSEVMTFDSARFQIRDFSVGSGSIFRGKSVEQLRSQLDEEFLVTSILRDNDFIIPDGKCVIRENDQLYLLSTEKDFEKIYIREGDKVGDIRKILLVGGGKTGTYVSDYIFRREEGAGLLSAANSQKKWKKRSLHIVEEDYRRCEYLSDRYPDAVVTHADISDEGFLEEENLSGFDLMVNLTGSPELNIIAGVYGKSRGVDRSMAVVKKNNYRTICKALDVDVIISKKNSVVNSIVKIVRKGDVRNVYAFSDSDLEAIELVIGDNSRATGTPVKELKLPRDLLILFISRGDETFIPTGDSSIEAGDVVAFITAKKSIRMLEKLVAERK